jgi:hypothetical protein
MLRHILLLLIAGGLLAAPGVLSPPTSSGGDTAAWRNAPQGPDELAICVRFETATEAAVPSKDCQPRVTQDGDGGPDSGVQPRSSPIARRVEALGPQCRTLDERSLLVQGHRRVNGSANAHGARA